MLVSEFMLQQTPVSRVEPVWREWLTRWPTPAALAAESTGEVVRAWGRLGYPRRALRLQAAAKRIVAAHDGEVPLDEADLRELPGVGRYTAAAVAAFAGGRHTVVLDTNILRVITRVVLGRALPGPPRTSDWRLAEELLPGPEDSPTWNVAIMEFGALVCTARAPQCDACPLRAGCAWALAGFPVYDGPPLRSQAWVGTDRQVRGRMMARLRSSAHPVPPDVLLELWPSDPAQAQRCVDSLVADGLAARDSTGDIGLPG